MTYTRYTKEQSSGLRASAVQFGGNQGTSLPQQVSGLGPGVLVTTRSAGDCAIYSGDSREEYMQVRS